jgi:uncharacterized protein YndB with AHSA1/START domain
LISIGDESMLTRMTTIEFELERTIQAPINEVFARLIDIDGYNDWMPKKGTMLKHTRQTSPGEPTVGTRYEEDTTQGMQPGEITEFEVPHKVVFHWWDTSRTGKLKSEGWPGYTLQAVGDNATLVRHHPKLTMYGMTRLMKPIYRVFAIKERTVTINALKASFESGTP